MTALKKFDFVDQNKTLFIFGGSQGSIVINQCVSEMIDDLKDVQVLWQTGMNHFEQYKHHETNSVRVKPFINDMKSAYAAADLALTRAGAMTITELTACGVASIMIPLPSAAEDHQTHNAAAMDKRDAAKMIPEADLSPDNLSILINQLFKDEYALNKMSKNSKALGKPNAVSVIADHILERIST